MNVLKKLQRLLLAVLEWWNHRRRQMDMRVLWPQCVRMAPDIRHARAAFAVHVYNDSAWDGVDRFAFISKLEANSQEAPVRRQR